MQPGSSDTLGRDYRAEARALLAGQLAQQLGFTRSVADLLAKFTDSVEQFKRAADSLPKEGADPALAKLLAELVAANTSILKRADGTTAVLETVADLKRFLDRDGGRLPAGFTAPPDRDAQRTAAAALAAKRAREEAAGLPELLAGLFGAVRRAAAAGLTGAVPAGSPTVSKPPSRLRRAYDAAKSAARRAIGKVRTAARGRLSRAKQAITSYTPGGVGRRLTALRSTLPAVGKQVGRLGRRAGRGLAAAGRAAGKIGGGIRAGLGAGRAAGGALSGAVTGGRLGAAAGPLGAVAGVIAGTVAGGAKALFDAGVGVFTTLTASLTRYLSPVAVVSAAISAQTSGYAGVGKAFQVLGATLGLLLLPVFTVFGALVLAVADELGEALLPALKDWSGAVLDTAVDATDALQAAFYTTRDVILSFGRAVGDVDAWLRRRLGVGLGEAAGTALGGVAGNAVGRKLDNAAAGRSGVLGGDTGYGLYDAYLKAARDRRLGGDAAGSGTSFLDKFRKGLSDMIEENKRALAGGPAVATNAADAARAAQLAALNGTPLEAKMLAKLTEGVGLLDAMAGHARRPAKPKGGQQ